MKKKRTPCNLEPHRNVLAIARDRFRDSNPEISVAKTLGHVTPNVYLANRIDYAFMAGWDAAERHYRHQMELRLTKARRKR